MEKKRKYNSFIIKANGKTIYVDPKNGTDFSLEELQSFVGGNIQIVHLLRGELMVINEEGKLRNLPVNEEMTILAKWKGAISGNDFIVGDALICHKSQIK